MLISGLASIHSVRYRVEVPPASAQTRPHRNVMVLSFRMGSVQCAVDSVLHRTKQTSITQQRMDAQEDRIVETEYGLTAAISCAVVLGLCMYVLYVCCVSCQSLDSDLT